MAKKKKSKKTSAKNVKQQTIDNLVEPPLFNKRTKIPDVIGMPPEPGGAGYDDASGMWTSNLWKNSMSIIRMYPMEPDAQNAGLTLFNLKSASSEYEKCLNKLGFSNAGKKNINVAHLSDHPITDTFQNDYGDSFLTSMTQGIATGAGEVAQILGTRTGTEAAEKLAKMADAAGNSTLSAMSGKAQQWGKSAADQWSKAADKSPELKNMGNLMNQLFAGARVDFPMIWKNSSFQQSFSLNVRLFNPNPASDDAHKKWIIGPLTALMLFAMPRTYSGPASGNKPGDTFNYPFFCKVAITGILDIYAAACTSMSITKGGDNNLVAFNKRVGMIDVRMDFISLFKTMTDTGKTVRPNIKTYIKTLNEKRGKMSPIYDMGAYPSSGRDADSLDIFGNKEKFTDDPVSPGVNDPTTEPAPRVDDTTKATSSDLEAERDKYFTNESPTATNSLTPSKPDVVKQMPDDVQTTQASKADDNKSKEVDNQATRDSNKEKVDSSKTPDSPVSPSSDTSAKVAPTDIKNNSTPTEQKNLNDKQSFPASIRKAMQERANMINKKAAELKKQAGL